MGILEFWVVLIVLGFCLQAQVLNSQNFTCSSNDLEGIEGFRECCGITYWWGCSCGAWTEKTKEQIWKLLGRLQYQLRHTNVIADFLASFAVQTDTDTDFSANGILPLSGRLSE
ncbi:unnamed protein product [Ilex paraguariensis]|uniref:Uncharacterized protein n=1 Tax=Ilex paraguariensis TaxID=185542 RepID=A0ABC8SC35_9AQUA